MKRSCNYCRAYKQGGGCELGYKSKNIYYDGVGGPVIDSIPLEDCPKPRTIRDLIREENKKKMEILKKLTTEQLKKMLTEIDNYVTECFIRAELHNRGEL